MKQNTPKSVVRLAIIGILAEIYGWKTVEPVLKSRKAR